MRPSAGPARAPVDPPQAAILRRLAASLYEALLLAALAVAVSLVLLPLTGPYRAPGSSLPSLPGSGARAVSLACLFAVWGAYCIGLWSGGRRSLPMRTWRLSLRDSTGAVVTPGRAALRYLAAGIGPACAIGAYATLRPYGQARWAFALLALNYAWAWVDRDRRFLQDRLAGTRLVYAGGPSPPGRTAAP